MTLTGPEFERQLQPLLRGWAVDPLADGWRLKQPECSIDIRCRRLPALRIGALELPRVGVWIAFAESTSEQQNVFLHDFLRHFGRGGG